MVQFIVAHNDDKVFSEYLMPWLQKWNLTCSMVSDSVKGVTETIFQKYNAGIKCQIDNGLKDDDVVAFCHEDVKLIDPNLIPKIELAFSEKSDLGLLGVVGATELSESGAWWHNKPENLRGHIIQENGKTAGHLIKGAVGYFDDLVVIDGLCFFVRGSLLINGLRFDERYVGYDFYDIDTCLTVLEKGFKVGVADILVQHRSVGDVSGKASWTQNKDTMIAKWKEKGMTFPLTQKQFLNDNIKTVEV